MKQFLMNDQQIQILANNLIEISKTCLNLLDILKSLPENIEHKQEMEDQHG